jgi:hypothetical protein
MMNGVFGLQQLVLKWGPETTGTVQIQIGAPNA